MISIETARNVVGVLGNILALFLFFSPMPVFIRICKKGAVEQYSSAPYLIALVNCACWLLYGLPLVHPNSTLIWTINGAGTLIQFVYVILFFIYSERKNRLKVALVVLAEVVFVVVLVVLIVTVIDTTERRSLVIGIIGLLTSSAMYAAPLSVMKLVIRTKSVEFMPLSLSVATFCNCVAWTIYALIPYDPFLCIPSALGILLSITQLILYATYYKSTKRQEEARLAAQKEAELGLSDAHQVVGNGHPYHPHPQHVVSPPV